MTPSRPASAVGCPVVQINTGSGCHLDAVMLAKGLQQLDPAANSVVLIEKQELRPPKTWAIELGRAKCRPSRIMPRLAGSRSFAS